MITKARRSVYWLGLYTFALSVIFCLLLAFSPRQTDISFVLPVDKTRMTLESGFGERIHPVLGTKRMHTGIDLVADEGTSVIAAEEGVVLEAHFAEAWGNIITVKHYKDYSTYYSHLKLMNVKAGDKLSKGQIIGQVGHTGLSTKSHLHFEVLKDGQAVDPISYLPALRK